MTMVEPTRFVVYGEPNEAARNEMADFGPTYLGDLRRLRTLGADGQRESNAGRTVGLGGRQGDRRARQATR